jgi:hypothetical protein
MQAKESLPMAISTIELRVAIHGSSDELICATTGFRTVPPSDWNPLVSCHIEANAARISPATGVLPARDIYTPQLAGFALRQFFR